MWSLIIKGLILLKDNLVPILISIGVGIVLFFVVGFFSFRQKLHEAEQKLTMAETQITQLKRDIQEITSAHVDISKDAEQYRKKSQELAKRLERRGKKPISELARKRAKLVEKAINSGTKKALECMETISRGGVC
jgi:septation ring formation regulator EzrA